ADFPLPLMGMVHLANRIEHREQLLSGDSLDVRAWAENLRLHRAGTQVELVTEVSRGGDVVWRGVSTYLTKGKTLRTAAPADATERVDVALPPVTGQWRLGADVGRRYAAVSGDRNPIHLSALTAKLFGFPRAIAHGMYTASRALATVGAARGEAFRWSVEFGKPVLLPGTVTFGLTAEGAGHTYAGWDAKRGRTYLSGAVTPL
uniref:MaoC/PaaZ C-terminal domain-containing protein n=1 Tax=Pseudactinotalea sp. TaxID=1926260 RepID=UPI003B3B821C